MRKADKFRLYPNKQQEETLFWTLARCRELADAAAPARRRCILIEGRHSGPRTPASDSEFQRAGIESAGSQVCAVRRLVAFLFAIREGARTVGAGVVAKVIK